MTLPVLRTRRLLLEPAGVAHLDLLADLNSDPEVMRYLLGRAATRAETEAEWAERFGSRVDEARGLGYWVGSVDGRFVGWWCASSYAADPAVSGAPGYRLRREAWGGGLATEGARAMVEHAFNVPGIEVCAASTMAVNTGSRRVLEKVGLVHVDTRHEHWDHPLPGAELGEVVYEVRRDGWPGPSGPSTNGPVG